VRLIGPAGTARALTKARTQRRGLYDVGNRQVWCLLTRALFRTWELGYVRSHHAVISPRCVALVDELSQSWHIPGRRRYVRVIGIEAVPIVGTGNTPTVALVGGSSMILLVTTSLRLITPKIVLRLPLSRAARRMLGPKATVEAWIATPTEACATQSLHLARATCVLLVVVSGINTTATCKSLAAGIELALCAISIVARTSIYTLARRIIGIAANTGVCTLAAKTALRKAATGVVEAIVLSLESSNREGCHY
jgi:hypothetical protein